MLALTSVENHRPQNPCRSHVSGLENWSRVDMGDVAIPRDQGGRLPFRLWQDPFEQGSQDSRAGIATGEHGARPAQIGGAFPPPQGNDGGP